MKLLKIKDDYGNNQYINLDNVKSIYPSKNKGIKEGGIHINCGNSNAIFTFRNVNIEQIEEAFKKHNIDILTV